MDCSQHRTLGSYLKLFINQDFIIQHIEEWQPDNQQLATMPSLLDERERPMLLLIAVQRPK
ncbi:MAG: hypothetical protein AB2989_04980 [Candidatus Symbiodolus clandestinus]